MVLQLVFVYKRGIMTKIPHSPSHLNENESDHWLKSGVLLEFLHQYSQRIILGLTIIFAALILLLFFSKRNEEENYQDYFKAKDLLPQVQEGKVPFAPLEHILKKHPSLNSAFAPLLAQSWMIKEDFSQAEPLAELALKQAKEENLPQYTSFAETTLLIEQGKLDLALSQAKQLQERLDSIRSDSREAPNEGDVLFTMNLIRIASLEQALNKPEEELMTWKRLLENTEDHPWSLQFLFEIAVGKISLHDYIENRIKQL